MTDRDKAIESILASFAEARLHGQQKYAGPCDAEYESANQHDLSHDLKDWCSYAKDHIERALLGGEGTMDARDHLVKAGGLMLSAVRTQDIRAGRSQLDTAQSPPASDVCECGHKKLMHSPLVDGELGCEACDCMKFKQKGGE